MKIAFEKLTVELTSPSDILVLERFFQDIKSLCLGEPIIARAPEPAAPVQPYRDKITERREELEEEQRILRANLPQPPSFCLAEGRVEDPEVLASSIDVIGLTVRARNALRQEGILTVGQLTKKSMNHLLRTPNLGRTSINVIIEALDRIGYKFVKS